MGGLNPSSAESLASGQLAKGLARRATPEETLTVRATTALPEYRRQANSSHRHRAGSLHHERAFRTQWGHTVRVGSPARDPTWGRLTIWHLRRVQLCIESDEPRH